MRTGGDDLDPAGHDPADDAILDDVWTKERDVWRPLWREVHPPYRPALGLIVLGFLLRLILPANAAGLISLIWGLALMLVVAIVNFVNADKP